MLFKYGMYAGGEKQTNLGCRSLSKSYLDVFLQKGKAPSARKRGSLSGEFQGHVEFTDLPPIQFGGVTDGCISLYHVSFCPGAKLELTLLHVMKISEALLDRAKGPPVPASYISL